MQHASLVHTFQPLGDAIQSIFAESFRVLILALEHYFGQVIVHVLQEDPDPTFGIENILATNDVLRRELLDQAALVNCVLPLNIARACVL